MTHTYSKDFCAECDAAYRSYACVANDDDANPKSPRRDLLGGISTPPVGDEGILAHNDAEIARLKGGAGK